MNFFFSQIAYHVNFIYDGMMFYKDEIKDSNGNTISNASCFDDGCVWFFDDNDVVQLVPNNS
jgi:hypothetical protein